MSGATNASGLVRISNAIDGLNIFIGKAMAWCVLLAVLISAGNAFSRYLFSVSSNAWLEMQWYLFSAIFLLGAPYTLALNEHVRVDIVYGSLSTRKQDWIDLLGGIFFLMPMALLICWMSWPVFADSWRIGEMSGNSGGLPRWPVKLIMPVGFALLALQGISSIIKAGVSLAGHSELHQQYERPLQ